MAAAEARAAWQRTANRYFVQEDAKRAPKLACCQSSTSSSKQVDSGLANATASPDPRVVGRFPVNRTPYSNLPSDAEWWLQIGMNFKQQFDSRTTDGEITSPVNTSKELPVRERVAMSEKSREYVIYKDIESFLEEKKPCESGLGELNVDSNKVDQDFLDVKNITDDYEFLEMEMVGSSICRETCNFSSNAKSPWIEWEKKVPWWRVSDGEELASFVAHKSSHHVKNCENMPVRRNPYKPAKSIENDEINMSSLDWEADSDAISSSPLGGQQRDQYSVQGLSQNEDLASDLTRINRDLPEKAGISNNDPCKDKILEALCHSQTRAREAEDAAKQAYTEKQHILKLFFRQASQLFAYKQWFKLLQLENLLLQSEVQSEDDSTPLIVFPDILPWIAQKPQKKLHKNWQKSSKGKRCRRDSQEKDIGKYAVAIAVGFTLVGAGLILGWTVGWLLPAF